MLPVLLQQAKVPAPVQGVLERLEAAGFEAFLVGGCVRDMLRGQAPKDFDVATRALPEQVQRLFKRVIPTGVEHGTVTVLVDAHPVEVTTYRVEAEYLDGRRPSKVEFRRELNDDLGRRDFTINAMAFSPLRGELRDPFGGQADLVQRRIRCVGAPAQRFSEDGLRALRAVRFAAVLEFSVDPATEAAIPGTLEVFKKVALERVKAELEKLLLSHDAARGLGLLRQTGLLDAFAPELRSVDPARFSAAGRVRPELPLRLAALVEEVGRPRELLARLKFPNGVADEVALLCTHPLPAAADTWPDGELRRWMAALGPLRAEGAVELAEVLGRVPEGTVRARILALLAQRPPLSARELALDGRAIMAILNVPPSPRVGQATRYLLEQVLDVPERNTVESLTALLRAWA